MKDKSLAVIVASLALWAVADRASGTTKLTVKRNLQEQIARADHVAHVVILERQSLEQVYNGPVSGCGLKYRVRVVEQFKGTLDQEFTSFATRRFLLPERLLQAGDHALVLLRQVPETRGLLDDPDAPSPEQLDAMSMEELDAWSLRAGTDACQRARGKFLLTDSADNIFIISFEQGSKPWFLYWPGSTLISPDIGTPKLPRCEPLPAGGCITKEPARIEWARVRDGLVSAKKRVAH